MHDVCASMRALPTESSAGLHAAHRVLAKKKTVELQELSEKWATTESSSPPSFEQRIGEHCPHSACVYGPDVVHTSTEGVSNERAVIGSDKMEQQ